MPDIQIDRWIQSFEQYQFDKLTFDPLFKRVLLILEDAWLRCLKEDVDRFTTAYYLSAPVESDEKEVSLDEDEGENEDEEAKEKQKAEKKPESAVTIQRPPTRPHSPETQINVANNVIYIKRPWLIRFISSAASERQHRFLEALENAMTDEERQRLKMERRERRRRMEENRKKAAKAAKERQKRLAKEKENAMNSPEKPLNPSRNDIPLYIDRVLPYKLGLMQSKDFQRLLSSDLHRFVKVQKSSVPNFEQKFNLLVEIAKVNHRFC